MKKLSHVLLLCSLLTYNSCNFSMQDDDIEADNNIITSEILYALETLSPANNETIEQRYNNLIKDYNENPYSILTSASTIATLEHQAEQELQQIQHAYQIMKNYNLTNNTSEEIKNIINKDRPKKLTKKEALNILNLPDHSEWQDIITQMFELIDDDELNANELAQVDNAYATLLKLYDKTN